MFSGCKCDPSQTMPVAQAVLAWAHDLFVVAEVRERRNGVRLYMTPVTRVPPPNRPKPPESSSPCACVGETSRSTSVYDTTKAHPATPFRPFAHPTTSELRQSLPSPPPPILQRGKSLQRQTKQRSPAADRPTPLPVYLRARRLDPFPRFLLLSRRSASSTCSSKAPGRTATGCSGREARGRRQRGMWVIGRAMLRGPLSEGVTRLSSWAPPTCLAPDDEALATRPNTAQNCSNGVL